MDDLAMLRIFATLVRWHWPELDLYDGCYSDAYVDYPDEYRTAEHYFEELQNDESESSL